MRKLKSEASSLLNVDEPGRSELALQAVPGLARPRKGTSPAPSACTPCPEVRARLPGQMHTHRHVRAAANPLRGFPKERRGAGAGGQAEMEEKEEGTVNKSAGLCEQFRVAVRQPPTLNK